MYSCMNSYRYSRRLRKLTVTAALTPRRATAPAVYQTHLCKPKIFELHSLLLEQLESFFTAGQPEGVELQHFPPINDEC